MENIENINLDLNLLHSSVFKYTPEISILGTLNSIDEKILKHLKNLLRIVIGPLIFKKINHKQGIEWIKQWNFDVNVINLTNITQVQNVCKEIVLDGFNNKPLKRLPSIFPDEDFCLYANFPFNQLVIITERIYMVNALRYIDIDLTCTYLWLSQHYRSYYNYFKFLNNETYRYYFQLIHINLTLNSVGFDLLKCDFAKRLSLCNKTNYQPKDYWDDSDFNILNKKIQTVFKI